jgi:polar amino acid transport system substrate-binding protein
VSTQHTILAAVALLLGCASAAHAQACRPAIPDSALVKKGTLVMSINPTLPPMQFVDRSGALKGMRVEMGEMIAKRLCLKPEYVRIEFSAMIPGLNVGRWDVINTGIFYTDDRAKMMHLLPYEAQAISISAQQGNPLRITKPDDLSGRSVGVEIGGFEEVKARELDRQLTRKGLKGINVRTFENFSMAFQALRAGQVEGTISIDSTATEYQKRGGFVRVMHGLFPTPVALAARNRVVADAMAKAIDDMKADGSFAKLLGQYGVSEIPGRTLVKGPAG